VSDDLVVHELNDAYAIATWRNVFITSWRQGVTVAALEHVDAISDAYAPQHPDGYVSASISFYRSKMPDDAARKKASDLMSKSQGRVRASCTVLEGEGFWAGTARSVVAAMNFTSGTTYAFKVAATIDEASLWLAPHAGMADGGAAIAAALQSFRARHAAV
jgi:hypothetical protein